MIRAKLDGSQDFISIESLIWSWKPHTGQSLISSRSHTLSPVWAANFLKTSLKAHATVNSHKYNLATSQSNTLPFSCWTSHALLIESLRHPSINLKVYSFLCYPKGNSKCRGGGRVFRTFRIGEFHIDQGMCQCKCNGKCMVQFFAPDPRGAGKWPGKWNFALPFLLY